MRSILIIIILIVSILAVNIYNLSKQKFASTIAPALNPSITARGGLAPSVTGTTGEPCSKTDLNGMWFFGNSKECDFLICNDGYIKNADDTSCIYDPYVICSGDDPNGYYTYNSKSKCVLQNCNQGYKIISDTSGNKSCKKDLYKDELFNCCIQ